MQFPSKRKGMSPEQDVQFEAVPKQVVQFVEQANKMSSNNIFFNIIPKQSPVNP